MRALRLPLPSPKTCGGEIAKTGHPGLRRLLCLAALLLSDCTQDTCDVSFDEPGSSLECPSGSLCYRGRCAVACTAGRERVEACDGDGDCSGVRSRCVDGFCSACEADETCIPILDICQGVTTIPLPPVPERPRPGDPRPPRPRTPGTLDAGLVVQRDAGTAPIPVNSRVSHAVFVDISETVNVPLGTQTSTLVVRSFNTDGNPPGLIWRIDVEPPATEELLQADNDCELNRLNRTFTVVPTLRGFGRIIIDDFNMSGALPQVQGGFQADWDASRRGYVVTPDAPDPLLLLSDFDSLDSTFVTVTGTGAEGITDGSWPDPEVSLHVPFDLRLEPGTESLLRQTQVLGQIPTRDLLFRWSRVGTGVVATERIFVRVPGNAHELVCRQLEGPNTPGAISLSAGLLEAFRVAEGAPSGRTYPLFLERSSAEQLRVDPQPRSPDVDQRDPRRLFVTVRVRHSFEGRIQF